MKALRKISTGEWITIQYGQRFTGEIPQLLSDKCDTTDIKTLIFNDEQGMDDLELIEVSVVPVPKPSKTMSDIKNEIFKSLQKYGYTSFLAEEHVCDNEQCKTANKFADELLSFRIDSIYIERKIDL